MPNQDLYVSRAGLEDLKTELAKLLEDRKDITGKIKEARELGDLSENSEYIEAKNKQSFVEGRIAEIEAMLKVAKVIDENNRVNGRVSLGSHVKLSVGGEMKEYDIAGSNEANPLVGKISNESPLGQALMGHKTGDSVDIMTPDGPKKCEIVAVS